MPAPTMARGAVLDSLGSAVYALRTADGLIKIGFTTRLGHRSSQLARHSDIIGVVIGGTLEDEQAIHDRLAGLAARGKEWYPAIPEVLAVVNEMRSPLGQQPLVA